MVDNILRSATKEETIAYKWLRQQGFKPDDDFYFYPLLYGGINLGFVRVNFYIRVGSAVSFPVGWRVRRRPSSSERARESHFIMLQETGSTARIVRIRADTLQTRKSTVLRRAIHGEEVGSP